MDRVEVLVRVADLLEEASGLLRRLAEEGTESEDRRQVRSGGAHGAEAPAPEVVESAGGEVRERVTADNETVRLLSEKGIGIRRIGDVSAEEEGLLTLARVMGRKASTIVPLVKAIKRAQSSRSALSLSLRDQPQEVIADVTLVASMASKAGLLPNYKYLKSPQYRLFCEAPVSPVAINFFTGQWLELFALQTVREAEAAFGVDTHPVAGVHVELPNGDQFELDLVFTVDGRLVWVEAKTTDDFAGLLPKYKAISQSLCRSERDAILLWSGFERGDVLQSTRGALARMTLCSPDGFPEYVAGLLSGGQGNGGAEADGLKVG